MRPHSSTHGHAHSPLIWPCAQPPDFFSTPQMPRPRVHFGWLWALGVWGGVGMGSWRAAPCVPCASLPTARHTAASAQGPQRTQSKRAAAGCCFAACHGRLNGHQWTPHSLDFEALQREVERATGRDAPSWEACMSERPARSNQSRCGCAPDQKREKEQTHPHGTDEAGRQAGRPLAPYPSWAGMISSRVSPIFIPRQPWSQPWASNSD